MLYPTFIIAGIKQSLPHICMLLILLLTILQYKVKPFCGKGKKQQKTSYLALTCQCLPCCKNSKYLWRERSMLTTTKIYIYMPKSATYCTHYTLLKISFKSLIILVSNISPLNNLTTVIKL